MQTFATSKQELFTRFLDSRQSKILDELFKHLKEDVVNDLCASLLIYLNNGLVADYSDDLWKMRWFCAIGNEVDRDFITKANERLKQK